MHPFILYILRGLAISGIGYGYYALLLRRRKMHVFNRYYLLATMAAALLLPLVHIEWAALNGTAAHAPIKLLQVLQSGQNEEQAVRAVAAPRSYAAILWVLYYCIVAVSLFVTARSVYQLYRIKRNSKVTAEGNMHFIETELDNAPFSFLNNLFWHTGTNRQSAAGAAIMRHELAHIRQWHSADKLAANAVLAFFWMNPFFWLVRRELSIVHEFIADEAAAEDNDTELFALMLLQTHFKGRAAGLIQPFFCSPVKTRLTMLQKTNKTKLAGLRRLMVLPLAAGAALLFSFSAKDSSPEQAKHKTVIVLDAAHGGTDNGGVGKSGITEKDMTLRITKELARMAPAYNVQVVTTRNGDERLTAEDRVAACAATGAELFVSIHVNQDLPADRNVLSAEKHPGFEVIVSNKNARYNESNVLASAIIGKLYAMAVPAKLVEKGVLVLKSNALPAVAIECGNIDNEQDIERLQDDKQLRELCGSILSGIAAYSNSVHE
ncbi:MAG: N-acetylmuramoyl-L-alanine amidase [Bacteroidota bacterium]